MAATMDQVAEEILRITNHARQNDDATRPRWPMIVLRTPKGWTCPREVDGKQVEDSWRSHQVPMGEMHENPDHVTLLEQWMRSYRPEELFADGGCLRPELVLYLQREHGLTPDEIGEGLNRRSGLLGVSGISPDMRIDLESARHGNERATLAIAMYCHRARQAVGALAATLGGVDALVFTAGVGENSPQIRAEICNGLECLGLHLDSIRNLECESDADIAVAKSPGRIVVIRTREDLTMLQQTMQLVESSGCAPETS